MWKCPLCDSPINHPCTACPACGGHTQIPSNVILAGQDRTELMARFEALAGGLCDDGSKRRITEVLDLLRAASKISINMHPESLVSILQDPNLRYTNLHDNLRAHLLINYDQDLAAKRKGIDNLAFGADGEKLNFAAVNLGTLGLYSYGACCVFLDSAALAPQISTLERNSFDFFKRTGTSVNFNIPSGSRALWEDVATLAVVKHFAEILSATSVGVSELAAMVLRCVGAKGNDDFIEVQIFPPITLRAFKKIVFDTQVNRPIKAGGLIARSAQLSRDLLGAYLKSLEGTIEVEIRP